MSGAARRSQSDKPGIVTDDDVSQVPALPGLFRFARGMARRNDRPDTAIADGGASKEAAVKWWLGVGKALVVAALFSACAVMWAKVEGVRSPWLGLFCMFYFMGIAKSAQPQFLFRMPSALRAVHPDAARAAARNRWGVRRFGALLRNTPLRYLNSSLYLSDRERDVPQLLRRIEAAEAIHFWAAVLFTPYIVYILARGLLAQALLFVLVQLVFNLYPILHLRLVRARFAKACYRSSGAVL
jgi:hypothetical protein